MTITGLAATWDALPRYRKRRIIRSLAVICLNGAITGYEARRIGLKEALTPRLIWNMSKERQKLQYLRYIIRAASVAVQNHLNEQELRNSGARKADR